MPTPIATAQSNNNNKNSSSSSRFVIGCTTSQSACLIVYLMMAEVVVGLQDMRAMIEFAPPLLNNKFLVTASSAFDGSAFQRRLRKTDSVEESRGSLLFDGVHGFMTDLGTYAGMIIYFPSYYNKFLFSCTLDNLVPLAHQTPSPRLSDIL